MLAIRVQRWFVLAKTSRDNYYLTRVAIYISTNCGTSNGNVVKLV